MRKYREVALGDPIVPVWVVGELDIPASLLDEKGALTAAEEILDTVGFAVTYAEPT